MEINKIRMTYQDQECMRLKRRIKVRPLLYKVDKKINTTKTQAPEPIMLAQKR